MKEEYFFKEFNKGMAQKYLSNSIITNNIDARKVNAYADKIKNGLWKKDGGSIKFDASGRLTDGQHRLTAIAENDLDVTLRCMKFKNEPVSRFKLFNPKNGKLV